MSLPMPSGNCWTKRTTESNRTAPEILRGFFAPYPPADASCRTSGHTPPNPLTADLPVTQAQTHTPQPFSLLSTPFTNSLIPSWLSYPSPAPTPKVKPGSPHAFPPHRRRSARPSRPACYPRRSPTPPFPHISPAPLTYIKIPEADHLRDFLLYQAQCDPHHSGGSDERSRGKGLFAQAQARQLSQE